jgi:cardiolipin synthase A/B
VSLMEKEQPMPAEASAEALFGLPAARPALPAEAPPSLPVLAAQALPAGASALERALLPLRPLYVELPVGMHAVALLKDGYEAFPAMLSALAEARSSICLETYMLRDDTTGRRFAEVLMDRARAGVEVNVIYDAWGSSLSRGYLQRLHEAGVRTLEFHPIRLRWGRLRAALARLKRRNHRKTIVVDGQVGFTGGMNIADDYAAREDGGGDWRDTCVRLEGPAAQELQYFFLRTWRRHEGAPLDEARYRSVGRRPDPKVKIVTSDLHKGRKSIRRAYHQAFRRARKRIWITSAYFLPQRRMLRDLVRAARRGVDVRIMLGGTTDVRVVLLASRAMYGRLLRAGVRVFEWYGRVLHAKTAIIDGHWSTIGTSNLDAQSLLMNLEVNAVIDDEDFGTALEVMFEEDLSSCEEVELARWYARPRWQRWLSACAFWFRNWL